MKTLVRLLFTALVLVATPSVPQAQDRAALAARLTDFRDQFDLEGGAAALVQGDQLLWAGGTGVADPGLGTPVTADTVHLIASISKTITATAVMQLVEDGRIDLDADVNRYLPFRVRNPRHPGAPITCRQLLTHTSTIQDDHYALIGEATFYFYEREPAIGLGDFCQSMLATDGRFYSTDTFADATPGATAIYSNVGFALLGYIAERASGLPFDELTRQRIFAPLGMTRTSWRLTDFRAEDLAMPLDAQGAPWGHYTFADYPDGGVFTSVNDLSRFLRAIMLGGEWNGTRILQRRTVRQMLDLRPRRALGWDVRALDTIHPRVLGHAGGERGVHTAMVFNPKTRTGAIVFFHKDFPRPEQELALAPLTSDLLSAGEDLLPRRKRTAATARAIDAYLAAQHARGAFDGAVQVVRAGRVVLSKGYGLADRDAAIPITPQTRFAIGSITKTFTSTAVLILQDRGLLQLDDPIANYLPDAPATWQAIQVRQLLDHTSGIPDYFEVAAEKGLLDLDPSIPRTHAEVIGVFRNEPLEFPPGTRYHYSNSGYYLLGEIIARAAGCSYETFVEREILRPLGLRGTGFDRIGADTGGVRATGYSVDERGAVVPAARFDESLTYAAGGLYSTVADLAIWARAQRAGQLVSTEALAQLLTPAVQVPLSESGRVGRGYSSAAKGAGWFVFRRRGRRMLEHDGGINGFLSELAIYPRPGLVVTLLVNLDVQDPIRLADAVADLALGQ